MLINYTQKIGIVEKIRASAHAVVERLARRWRYWRLYRKWGQTLFNLDDYVEDPVFLLIFAQTLILDRPLLTVDCQAPMWVLWRFKWPKEGSTHEDIYLYADPNSTSDRPTETSVL